MKKTMILLLVVLMAVAALDFPALAEGRELAPPSRPVGGGPQYVQKPAAVRNAQYFNVTANHTPTLGSPVTWTVTPKSGYSFTQYQFILAVEDEFVEGNTLPVVWMDTSWRGNTFTYTCYQSKKYWLVVYGKDSSGTVRQEWVMDFTVAANPNANSLEKKVQQIASQLTAGVTDEYTKALKVHDWIINNCYYDESLCRHGAEDLFFSGTTVCDGYSKAYYLLLRAAGMQCIRVTGTANGGSHAWNAVRINGVWCQVDCTWDDPLSSAQAVSGYESHDYFGLNDTFMRMDHTYSSSVACTSLQYCYAYRTGEYRTWMYYVITDPKSVTIPKQLSAGKCEFDGDTQGRAVINVTSSGVEWYSATNSTGQRMLSLGAALLSLESWKILDSYTVPIKVTYNSSTYKVHVSVDLGQYTLKLPADMTSIESGAFQGDSRFLAVEMDTGVASIGDSAFANCSKLLKVVIPNSSVSIASSAFTGNHASITFFCPSGGSAATYARNKGFTIYYQ